MLFCYFKVTICSRKINVSTSKFIVDKLFRMGYYVLLYDVYCISVPSLWIDFDRRTFQMPKKHTELSKACMKQIAPTNDWQELTFTKKFGPYGTSHNLQQLQGKQQSKHMF